MRSCSSAITSFGVHVRTVQLRTSPPDLGSFHRDHSPAMIIMPVGHRDRVGLLLFDCRRDLLPLVESVGDDKAALAPLPRVAKCRLRCEVLGSGVESAE